MAYNMKDPRIVRQIGVEALYTSLGAVGMANFFRQFDLGIGDYTKERNTINGDLTVDEISAQILATRK
jgi:hypothetical protein